MILTIDQIISATNSFFFAPESDSTIATFRIFFGFILLVNSCLHFAEAQFWIGPSGVFPDTYYRHQRGHLRYSLFNYLGASAKTVNIILIILSVGSFFLMIGFLTRVSAFVVFFILISLHNRNTFISNGGDTVIILMVFLLTFSSAGNMLSLDYLIHHSEQPDQALITYSSPWCWRLMQIQVAIIYSKAFLSKAKQEKWLNGTAAYYAMQMVTFQRFSDGAIFKKTWVQKMSTWGTMAIQFSMGTLIWIEELRYPVLLMGLSFHVMSEYHLNIQLFGITMICCLILFVDPHDLALILNYIY